MAQTFGNFTAGDDNFFLDKLSQLNVLEQNFLPNIQNDIFLNKPVLSIEQLEFKVRIVFSDGETTECDKVLITVPISQLQKEKISFTPELS